jgi:hypothetical protein
MKFVSDVGARVINPNQYIHPISIYAILHASVALVAGRTNFYVMFLHILFPLRGILPPSAEQDGALVLVVGCWGAKGSGKSRAGMAGTDDHLRILLGVDTTTRALGRTSNGDD